MSNEKTLGDLLDALTSFLNESPGGRDIPVVLALDTGGREALPWCGDFDVHTYRNGDREAMFYPEALR